MTVKWVVTVLLFCTVMLVMWTVNERFAANQAANDQNEYVDRFLNDDAEMNAAITRARNTANQFVQRFLHPKLGDEQFSVAMMLSYQSEMEHVWISDLSYEDGIFEGRIRTAPEQVTHVRQGEQTQVGVDEISDWFWVHNGKPQGGFTLSVLLNRLKKAEAVQFRQQFPLDIIAHPVRKGSTRGQ